MNIIGLVGYGLGCLIVLVMKIAGKEDVGDLPYTIALNFLVILALIT